MIVLFNDVHYYYLLGKGGYVFGGVGLSVCLFVCLWTTLLKKLWTDWDEIFRAGSWVVQWRTDDIVVVIWVF